MRHCCALAVLLAAPVALGAQTPRPIVDNSFLVEEAFNQEPGVVQHLMVFEHGGEDDWSATFAQEWPVGGERYQVGFAIPVVATAAGRGIGDLELAWRVGVRTGQLALAPRLAVSLPTADSEAGRGAGSVAVDANLPLSFPIAGRLSGHANLGAFGPVTDVRAGSGIYAGASLVIVTAPWMNLLMETLAVHGPGATGRRETVTYLNPAVRFAFMAGSVQVVPAIARTFVARHRDRWLLYLSGEHPL